MASERPEKLGDGFVVQDGDLRFSMPAFMVLMRAVLDKGRSIRFAVRGKSMTPFIKDGDLITIAPMSVGKGIGPGEVVAYLHRLPNGRRLRNHVAIGLFEQALLAYLDPDLQREPRHDENHGKSR